MPPQASVIIVSWNTRSLLEQCLRSLQDFCHVPVEIIVVDNASSDGTGEMVRASFPAVRLIANTTNRGFAAANNQGLTHATAPVLVFLNADTRLIDGSLEQLISAAAKSNDVGAWGPRLQFLDGRRQASIRHFPRLSDQLIVLAKLRHWMTWTPVMRRYIAVKENAAEEPVDVEQIMGAAMVIPRHVLTAVGGWDERYWIWFEEVDLCRRILAAGYRIVFDPRVTIVHAGEESFRQVLSLKKQRWLIASLWRYAKRWWPTWQLPILAGGLALSMILTLIQTIMKPR